MQYRFAKSHEHVYVEPVKGDLSVGHWYGGGGGPPGGGGRGGGGSTNGGGGDFGHVRHDAAHSVLIAFPMLPAAVQ